MIIRGLFALVRQYIVCRRHNLLNLRLNQNNTLEAENASYKLCSVVGQDSSKRRKNIASYKKIFVTVRWAALRGNFDSGRFDWVVLYRKFLWMLDFRRLLLDISLLFSAIVIVLIEGATGPSCDTVIAGNGVLNQVDNFPSNFWSRWMAPSRDTRHVFGDSSPLLLLVYSFFFIADSSIPWK